MPSITAISELAISELLGEEHIEIETELLLERRPVMIIGPGFFRAEMGEEFDETPIPVLLERTGWAIAGFNRDGSIRNDPSTVKLLREIWPIVRGTVGTILNIYAGSQAITPEDTIAWQGPFPFIVGQDSSVQPLIEGAYLAIKITSDGQPPWALLQLDLDVEPTGEVYD